MFSTKAIFSTLSILALANSAFAAPITPGADIILIDAVGNEYPVSIPSNQQFTYTYVDQSISHIAIDNEGSMPCAFYGIDGIVIVSSPGDVKYMDVGPPQTIVGGICGPIQDI